MFEEIAIIFIDDCSGYMFGAGRRKLENGYNVTTEKNIQLCFL